MLKRFTLTALAALAIAAPVSAQTWETPTFFAPNTGSEIGGYLVDPDGGDLGFMVAWRQTGRINLGLRGGMGGREGNRSALLGIEFFGPIVTPAQGRPLAVSWLTGGGASFNGDFTALRIPVGVSIGAEIPGTTLTVTPYAHPRLALDIVSFDDDTNSDLHVDADFGADLAFGSWIARFGLTVGENEALGVGLAYRIPRRATVR